jgi:hypothetical protein
MIKSLLTRCAFSMNRSLVSNGARGNISLYTTPKLPNSNKPVLSSLEQLCENRNSSQPFKHLPGFPKQNG